ncbi:MAG: LamG-like jellyroll fold domain-containing protein, partial [Candidatus Thorarchaeota archaeon]
RDSTGDPTFRIYVADEDNVAAFTQGYPLLPDLYDWVNTSIYWDPSISGPGRYNTPDLSPLIQKVVSRPGWQSGNYICIMIDIAFSTVQMSYIEIKGSTGFPQGQLAQLNVDFIAPDPSDVIPSFRYNKDLVIDHTRVASDLQNFPVLVDIWDEDLHLNVQPDGDDIAFLYKGQVIPHDLDMFDKKGNGTHAHLVCWVKVPHLSSVEDTNLVMVYGDEDLGSQEDPEDVWESDYSAVWHMSDNPAQPQWDSTYADYLPHQPQVLDRTLLNLDGQTYGSMTSSDSVSGYLGDAIDLDGGNDFVDFGTPAELQMTGAFTVEAWFKADFVDNDYLVVKSGESNYRGWDLSFDDDPIISPAGWVMFRFSPDGVNTDIVGYERVDTGYWYHVVGVFNPSSYVRFYLNGELAGELTTAVPASVNDPNRPVRIGRRSDNPGGTSYLDAIVDEVRISSIARSEAWIKTQYYNQKNPQLFMTVGDEGINFRYMKDITIDHNKVEANLTSFPVLIDIYDSDLRTNVQADGDDIAFLANGRSLSHEIELFDQGYNSTHAHLVAWIKTDLSSVTDTVLTMYYGNPSIGNQENPAGVWGIDYFGVWHLSETSGDALDSTYLGIDGTVAGGPTRSVSGTVGYAYDVDGVDDYVSLASAYTEVTGTYSFWIYPKGFPVGPNRESNILAASDTLNRIHVYNEMMRIETSTNDEYFYFSSSSINTDTWYHVVIVRSGDFADLYVNGAWVEQVETVGASALSVDSIGGTDDISRMFNGTIDEVRIGTPARSAGWVNTEYRNQNDPSNFYSLGTEREVVTPKEVPLIFKYKKDITVDHNNVNSDLSGFPVLIDIYDTDLRTDVQADGDDIVFVKDGWILPYEIELFEQLYNSSHAHLIAWVRTDLSSVSDTVVSMHYGNPDCASYEDSESVWDTSFEAVWHLNEDPSVTVYDSTANGNDGVGHPTGSEPTLQTGKIFGCSEFYGEATNDRIEAPHSSSLVLPTDMLVEAWVRTSNSDSTSDVIVAKWGDVGHRNYWLGKIDGSTLAFYVDNTQSVTTSLSWINDGNWHHVVGLANSTSGNLFLYIDGIERGNDAYSGSTQTGTSVIQIGNNPGSTGFIQEWDGRIDEVRVSSSYRSLGWIQTEFNNQDDPTSFFTVGSEVSYTPLDFEFKKDIIIDHTKVGTDLNDFPLLIDLFDADLRSNTQSDGDDIFFKNGANKLPHEIELFDKTYNSTHAHLVAWVKVDLSSSIDTMISMYYGNPTLGNQEDPAGVWNSNYVAVWHMNQDPSSSMMIDSTSNGYDLTATGFVSDQRIYDGKIGTAISVDGVNDRFGISGISGPINDFTFQSWFALDNPFPSGSDMHFFRGNSLTNDYPLMRFATSSGLVVTHIEVTSDPDDSCTGSKSSWEADTWFQFAWARSMSAVRSYHYLDGSLDAEDNSADNANPHLAWNQLAILSDFAGGNMWGPGAISEFRILNVTLSPEWIAAEYANQNDPVSFYSVGAEEQIGSPQEPSVLDADGYKFTTSSYSSITIGAKLSLGTQISVFSYADDLTLGTSFSIENGSLPIWTANILVSPPPEVDTVSFEISYPEGEWWPFSVKTPTGVEKTFATDWTCFDGKLIVGSNAIDEFGMWKIQFLDRNHILDMQMGPTGGPYSQTDEFTIGQDIEYRVQSSGTIGSTISLELTDPSGSTWYSGSTMFQGLRFTLPFYHRKALTVSHLDVAEDLVNFPVLVNIYDTDLRTDTRSDGRDIAFAIGEETLSHELELFNRTFNSTHAHLVAWVNVPLLSGSSDTVITMYYGNPLAPIVYDSGQVWDSGYLGVWHLGESGTGALDEYLDSSQFKHHGQGGEGNSSFVPTQI